VAVELNAQMIDRTLLETTPVKEGDQLEFLFYMGGGR
jgi:sulfur carrier protein